MDRNPNSASSIVARLKAADATQLPALERALAADTRASVQHALQVAQRRVAALQAEEARLNEMYQFQNKLAAEKRVVGLDEVGRGPLAGPLAVGAVVLPDDIRIAGLNDSKKVPAAARESIAEEIRKVALAYTVQFIEPDQIDTAGMTASLRVAFRRAIAAVEEAGVACDVVLLDGNAMHLDPREINVIKGDGKCASIAAASIIAKVERDALMVEYAARYPGYGFEKNKGYASAQHQDAIREKGLCPIHRASFCTAFLQDSLF